MASAEVLKELQRKHPSVKLPVGQDVSAWPVDKLSEYFEKQVYLDSMLDSDVSDEFDSDVEEADRGAPLSNLDKIMEVTAPRIDIQKSSEPQPSLSPLVPTGDAKKSTEGGRAFRVMVYGATGYTGQLICKDAISRDMDIVMAGRNESKLRDLSSKLSPRRATPIAAIDLWDTCALDRALEGTSVVVHCAGPFAETFAPMVEACIRNGVHYVDINGEISVIDSISQYSEAAKRKGIMLLPAVGFDVVPSDTLAFALSKKVQERDLRSSGCKLKLYFHYNESGALISRGTSNVMRSGKRGVYLCRESGKISEVPSKAVPLAEREQCSYAPYTSATLLSVKPASMADVATAFFSTGIANIYCYMSDKASMIQFRSIVTPFSEAVSDRGQKTQPIGPTDKENEVGEAYVHGSIHNGSTKLVSGTLKCPAPYKVTYMAVRYVLDQISQEGFKPGFNTPTTAFGLDFLGSCQMKLHLD